MSVNPYAGRRDQSGVGMIEVLVAILVLSIGVLGYAGLQLNALGNAEDAHNRTQALAIAQDLVERVAANPNGWNNYVDSAKWPNAGMANAWPGTWSQCVAAQCDANTMANWDIEQIRWLASNTLPNGRVFVSDTCNASGILCVNVGWNETPANDCDPASDDCIQLEALP